MTSVCTSCNTFVVFDMDRDGKWATVCLPFMQPPNSVMDMCSNVGMPVVARCVFASASLFKWPIRACHNSHSLSTPAYST
uniref:Uncharacterized protein n=1 Tax=Phytophthora fragariae TaxID=53985 RepID=A0A6A3DG35_9STRA|nr:hypothetical protein PF009_g29784 [Phytophthora fragariae]